MITTLTEQLFDGSTGRYAADFADAAGTPVLTADAVSLTATLENLLTGAPVFTDRAVLNANGGTYDDGAFSLVLSPADLATSGDLELHPRRLTLRLTYSGTLVVTEVIEFYVRREP